MRSLPCKQRSQVSDHLKLHLMLLFPLLFQMLQQFLMLPLLMQVPVFLLQMSFRILLKHPLPLLLLQQLP